MLYRFGANTPVAQLSTARWSGVYMLCRSIDEVAFTIAGDLGLKIEAMTETGSAGTTRLSALVGRFPTPAWACRCWVLFTGARAAGRRS
jgi:hypothetical protein